MKGDSALLLIVLGLALANLWVMFFNVFLTIGIPSWQGRTDELRRTLKSLFSHVTPEDTKNLLVVVSVETTNKQKIIELLTNEFNSQLENGLLQVVSPTSEYLKVLAKPKSLGLKNFGTGITPEFLTDVRAFNTHFIFLLEYCHRQSEFVMNLSDEVVTLKRFLPTIWEESETLIQDRTKHAITFGQQAKFISTGRLFLSTPTVKEMSEFASIFGPNILPYDVIEGYRSLRISRGEIVQSKSALFADLPKIQSDRPPAELSTSLGSATPKNGVEMMYTNDPGFFWSVKPKSKDYIKVTLKKSVRLKRVRLATGTPYFGDYAHELSVKLCPEAKRDSTCDEKGCKEIMKLGDPVVDISGLEKTLGFPVKCVKLDFENDVDHWVIFRDMGIWIASNTTST
ncbi:predicted protein [Nematostella vectensis]|uniref:MGAT4 conserved region domain-containing protein n=1 Tax=Nematostella vectensis TaxID=45351 RepID=A7SUE5_NEMVE|nr:predicted protein [Nematostella vectensis]|eukprot:XP_001624762.1 predicted protein [Nematostella vectensis]